MGSRSKVSLTLATATLYIGVANVFTKDTIVATLACHLIVYSLLDGWDLYGHKWMQYTTNNRRALMLYRILMDITKSARLNDTIATSACWHILMATGLMHFGSLGRGCAFAHVLYGGWGLPCAWVALGAPHLRPIRAGYQGGATLDGEGQSLLSGSAEEASSEEEL